MATTRRSSTRRALARVAAAGTQREQLELFADDISRRLERTGPLLQVVASARAAASRRSPSCTSASTPPGSPTCAASPSSSRRNGPLRVDDDVAAETVWALTSPELYVLLTEVRGWSRERYAAWLADSLRALLSAPTSATG